MSNFKSNFEVIRTIGEPALLEQLAEECAELAHAALKLARLGRWENPTQKTDKECMVALAEEIADVSLCIRVVRAYLNISNMYDLVDMSNSKMERWVQRIRKARGEAPKEAPKETPEEKKKTRLSEFLKMFPNAVKIDGIPNFCPRVIDLKYMPSGGCENIACGVCKKCYWEAEVE